MIEFETDVRRCGEGVTMADGGFGWSEEVSSMAYDGVDLLPELT